MENKLHIQEESINEADAKRIETKQKAFSAIKDNIYYIYIVIMIIANCLISLIRVDEEGTIGIRYPSSGLGWALWITQILLITFIGVMILEAFRRQGIKLGHGVIKNTYNNYISALSEQEKDIDPRSLKEYMTSNRLRDSITKGGMLIAINLLAISATITANLNAMFALIVNIVFAVSFGIKALLDAEDYVITELVVWYKIKTKQLKNKKERKK